MESESVRAFHVPLNSGLKMSARTDRKNSHVCLFVLKACNRGGELNVAGESVIWWPVVIGCLTRQAVTADRTPAAIAGDVSLGRNSHTLAKTNC